MKLRNPRDQKLYQLEFHAVAEDSVVPLLGKKVSEDMKLMKVHYENMLAVNSIVIQRSPRMESGLWSKYRPSTLMYSVETTVLRGNTKWRQVKL